MYNILTKDEKMKRRKKKETIFYSFTMNKIGQHRERDRVCVLKNIINENKNNRVFFIEYSNGDEECNTDNIAKKSKNSSMFK